MKTKNQMSRIVYIVLLFLTNLLYGILFFRFLYDQTLFEFEGWFSVIYCIFVFLGAGLNYDKHRTIWSVIAILTCPYGIYCLIAYPGAGTIIISVLFVIGFGLIAVDIFIKNFPKNADKEYIIMIRVKKLLRRAHSLLGLCSLVLMCIVLVSNGFTNNTSKQSSNIEKPSSITFSIDDWNTANLEQRIQFAQNITDYESERLSLKTLCVEVENMSEYRLGYYMDSKSKIVINSKLIMNDDMISVFSTIAHEVYHSFQYSLIINGTKYSGDTAIDKEISGVIDDYKKEFNNYKEYSENNSSEDEAYLKFYEYKSQRCEISANRFAETEAVLLYKIVLSNNSD